MKSAFSLLFVCLISFSAAAQGNNRKPKIIGQEELSTNEDESITILMSHLLVDDPDDWFYPWGFTMKLYPGSNYTLEGQIVVPSLEFSGKLEVEVSVHDGVDESNKFKLEIAVYPVNDKPRITGHTDLSTDEDKPVTIQTDHLRVTDPDDKYPDDFTMTLHAGNNYTFSGSTVTPQTGFFGTLNVNISVNDGALDSDLYALPIEVKQVNRVPEITGQVTLQVNEDQSLTILLSQLTVVDDDNSYPSGFTLSVATGENYTVSNTTVTPVANHYGKIIVPVTVNDGKNTSKPFNLSVTVTPVNDPPGLTNLESDPIFFKPGNLSVAVSESISISDVDGDSIMFAEVGFRSPGYTMNVDKLVFTPTANNKIRGVFDTNAGTLTLLGQASPASYTVALRSVFYEGLPAQSGEGKVLYFSVNDGKSGSEQLERTLLFGRATISLEIPSGFTPNGDSANDTWKIVPVENDEEFSGVTIRVYNKAGTLVYESVGFENEWDGRMNGELLPADTYFYTIDLNLNSPEGYLKGPVTILR